MRPKFREVLYVVAFVGFGLIATYGDAIRAMI